MPRYSILIEFEVNAIDELAAREIVLGFAGTGIQLEGLSGDDLFRLYAGDGSIVDMDALSKQHELVTG